MSWCIHPVKPPYENSLASCQSHRLYQGGNAAEDHVKSTVSGYMTKQPLKSVL